MVLPLATDQELIRRSKNGEETAFEKLVEAYTPALFAVIRRLTDDDATAENIVQEAFWRSWKNLPFYKNDRPFFPYLVTVAVNLRRDEWRNERWLDFSPLEDSASGFLDPLPSPEGQLEQNEMISHLAAAIQKLPPAYRLVISLKYDGELSYEEISGVLNLPTNTVRTHLHRAKNALRKMLTEEN